MRPFGAVLRMTNLSTYLPLSESCDVVRWYHNFAKVVMQCLTICLEFVPQGLTLVMTQNLMTITQPSSPSMRVA
jgi:hypothetical protein